MDITIMTGAWGTNAWAGSGSLSTIPGTGTLRAQSGFVVDTNSAPFVQATHSLVEFTGNRERPNHANSVASSVAHLTGDLSRTTTTADVADAAIVGPQPLSSSKVLARTADGVLGALDNITLNLTDDTSYKRYTQWTYTLGAAATTPSQASIAGWWQVDLGGAHRIDRIRVYNQGDGSDLNGLTVSVTGGGANWHYTHSGAINNYIDIDVGSEIGEVVRLETVGGGNFLALAQVEIFGNLALAEPDVMVRKTYSLAGQPIATRVSGHTDANQNGLFYVYTDHLGGVSSVTTGAGEVIDTQRFLPFGEYRTAPSTEITERGFTGHRENRDIGLTYMNARYYVPYANRFASADTIVPDPTNPQAFNRYSYVYNNPLNFVDPDGHNPVNTKPSKLLNAILDRGKELNDKLETDTGRIYRTTVGTFTVIGGFAGGAVGTSICAASGVTVVGLASCPWLIGGGSAAGAGSGAVVGTVVANNFADDIAGFFFNDTELIDDFNQIMDFINGNLLISDDTGIVQIAIEGVYMVVSDVDWTLDGNMLTITFYTDSEEFVTKDFELSDSGVDEFEDLLDQNFSGEDSNHDDEIA